MINKKNRNRAISVTLIFGIIFISACSGVDFEKKNKELEKALVEKNVYIKVLKERLKETKTKGKRLEEKLLQLKNNNSELNISLEQSAFLFTKKHEEKIEEVEKEAYSNAEGEVSSRYFSLMINISLFFIFSVLVLLLTRKRNIQFIVEKNRQIEDFERQKQVFLEDKERDKSQISELMHNIDTLKRKHTEASKNQVVTMIEEQQLRKEELLSRVGGISNG